jgi:putative hydrolase of the HAD superfamily
LGFPVPIKDTDQMSKNHIANIIFDLGDVLIHIDVDRTVNGLKELGIGIPENESDREEFFDLLKRLETGKIEPSDFRNQLRAKSTFNPTDQELDRAWSAMLLDFEPDTIRLLEELRDEYNLYLLSNTNAIHVPYFNRRMNEQLGFNGLDPLFKKIYYSHEVKFRKPDPAIYTHVLNDSDLNPNESLFIDDREENIKAARALGICAHQYDIGIPMRLFITELLDGEC